MSYRRVFLHSSRTKEKSLQLQIAVSFCYGFNNTVRQPPCQVWSPSSNVNVRILQGKFRVDKEDYIIAASGLGFIQGLVRLLQYLAA